MSAQAGSTAGSRRRPRISGDDREAAILTTAQRLLEQGVFASATVDDFARGADISRPTFYFYFPSKNAVLLALLDRQARKISARALGLIADSSSEPWLQWRSTIRVFLDTVVTHRALVSAVLDARESSTEISEAWNALLQTWIDGAVTQIEQERVRGVAPVSVAAGPLATMLCLMNERAVQQALAADASEEEWAETLDTLTHVWVSSIYQAGRS